jgi:hypothetical protein
MKNTILDTFCPTCSHELVHGVACDWKPGECPFIKNKNRDKKEDCHPYHGEQIASSDEEVAILSSN